MIDLRAAAEALCDAICPRGGVFSPMLPPASLVIALRAALDAPPRGVTVEEVREAVQPIAYDLPAEEIATALLPLIERASLAGFAEGIKAAAGECETRAVGERQAANANPEGSHFNLAHRGRALALEGVSRAIRSLAPEADEWRPIETAPKDGQKLLVARKGYGHGGWVRMIALFIPKHTEESSEDYAEYDEDSDTYYTPEGWYEQCYEHDEWSCIRMLTDPLLWRPLPSAPSAQGGEG